MVSLLKILSALFVIGFLCIFYILLKNKLLLSPINQNNYHYEGKHHHSKHKFISISTNIKIISMPVDIKIIPMPHFISSEDSALLLSNGFRIVSKQKNIEDLEFAIIRYSKYISSLTGFSTNLDQNSSPSENTLIIDCPSITSEKNTYPKLGEDESYTLNISKTGIYLRALSLTGIIRGLSTFVQLIERDKSSEQISVPFVSIADRPRFPWRGLLLDVSRHWMPIPVIERTLNAMELSKLNVLHFHLSDDQGFRVQSLQYPLLHDRKNFFTQKDIQYLVEYARQRRIRIVPEFDIPGHTTR
jgi:hexosaminidase